MELSLYKAIIILICIFFIVDRLKKRINGEPRQSLLKVMVTIILWGSIAIMTLYPSVFKEITGMLGIEQDSNSPMLIGFLILLILLYKFLTIIERIEKNITEIVRREALKDIEKKG